MAHHCGHCMTLVENDKYTCKYCSCYLCPVHRGRRPRLVFGAEYYCLVPCPANPRADHATAASSSLDLEGGGGGPPPPGRPPSASRLQGQTTALQTSFGVIQQQDPSPARPSQRPPPRWYEEGGGGDGGEVQCLQRGATTSSTTAPSQHPSATEVYRHGTVTRRSTSSMLANTVASDDVAIGVAVAPYAASSMTTATSSSTDPAFIPPASSSTLSTQRSHNNVGSSGASSGNGHSSSFRMPSDAVAARSTTTTTTSFYDEEASDAAATSAASFARRAMVARRLLPLVIPEPADATTGLREVHLSHDMKIQVLPEEKLRFLEIQYSRGAQANQIVRGTIVGTDNGVLVFQERGRRFAQRLLPQQDGRTQTFFAAARCKHCGNVYPRDESNEHVATHRKGGNGADNTTIVDNEVLGTACGDTALLKRLIRLKQLGSGAQGDVWLCRDDRFPVEDVKANARTSNPIGLFVVKVMSCASEKEAIQKYQQSVRLMNLEHVHLIRYLAVQRPMHQPAVTVVMPYYNEGDLSMLIRNSRQPLDEHYVCSLLLQILTALEFMHSRTPPVIHGDIKPENVLLYNRREQVVLMDLDASKELVGVDNTSTTVTVGTTEWMAPETLHHEQGTPRSDIWSLGLLAYVLTVLPEFPMLPCAGTHCEELLNSVSWAACGTELPEKIVRAVRGRGYSAKLAQLIVRMMSHDERKRPSAREGKEMIVQIMTELLTR